MNFKDIPQFINDGNYEVSTSLDYLLEKVKKWIAEDGLQLNPDFQRGRVWTNQQQIDWLEYFLAGGKSGIVLYFNAPWWGDFNKNKFEYKDFVLVDGLQRLTALIGFLKGKIAIFDGKYITNFEGSLHSCADIKINVNNLQSKNDVLTWYLQMNSGGTPHTQDELDRVKKLIK